MSHEILYNSMILSVHTNWEYIHYNTLMINTIKLNEGYSATRAFVRNLKYSVLGKMLIFFMLFVYPVTMIGKQYVKISWIR